MKYQDVRRLAEHFFLILIPFIGVRAVRNPCAHVDGG